MCVFMSACLLRLPGSHAIEITSPPQNSVAVAGTSIQLTCGVNEPYEGYFEWRSYNVGQLGGKQVYSYPPFSATDPKYHQFGDFGLEIRPVEWRDAGKYSCAYLTGDVRETASIVILGQLKISFIYSRIF